jgi:hypothetical protein
VVLVVEGPTDDVVAQISAVLVTQLLGCGGNVGEPSGPMVRRGQEGKGPLISTLGGRRMLGMGGGPLCCWETHHVSTGQGELERGKRFTVGKFLEAAGISSLRY